MTAKGFMLRAAVLAAVSISGRAFAADTGKSEVFTLSETPASQTDTAAKETPSEPLMMEAAGETPNIHGFVAATLTSQYTTPRGLVVENQGWNVQPIVGLVFPVGDIGFMKKAAIVGGIWNSITFHQNDTRVGAWNEMDVFAGYGFGIADTKFHFDFTYGMWNFPQSTVAKPKTEHNLEFKLSYDDTGMMWDGFGFNPYVNVFYAAYGSSTVVLGHGGSTGYVELGLTPTFKTGIVTWTFPTYISVGPEDYWDDKGTYSDQNFGVFSTTIQGSIPLTDIIPARFGYWHLDAGVQYYYIINDALLQAGNILSGNDDRNVFRGYVTVGLNF